MLGFARGDALQQELGEPLAGAEAAPMAAPGRRADRRIACREGFHKDVLPMTAAAKLLWGVGHGQFRLG